MCSRGLIATTVFCLNLLGVAHQCFSQQQAEPPLDAPTNGKLLFDDEFKALDPATYKTSYWWGARWLDDGEQEVYVDPAYSGSSPHPLGLSPFSISGTGLQIQAAVPAPTKAPYLEGQRYTSGLLTTYDSFNQLYGYFEIQAKVPAGKGYWPAFWMLPKVDMPTPPEIDVVEVLGDRLTDLYVTAHWNEPHEGYHQTFDITVPDLSADFHRYGVSWTAADIAWYFDGKRVAYTATPPDLHQPMYMLLNLAVGGKWPGLPNSMTTLPGNFMIKYIKVFSLGS